MLAGRANIAGPSKPRWGRLIVALAFLGGIVFASLMARIATDRQGEADRPVVDAATRAIDIAPPVSRVPAFISLPPGVRWAQAVDDGVPNTILAISPDGRRVVFSGRTEDGTALWLRSLAVDDARQLPGTEDGVSPFWSPDGASIGFFADRQLKRLDVDRSGVPTALCEVRSQRGGTWGPDNTIVFSPFSGPLRRISANGGPVMALPDPEEDEAAQVRPYFLAGTRQIIYRVTSRNGRNNSYYVTSLDSTDRTLIGTFDSGSVTYSHGHLLFMQNHTLMAQPFDHNRLTITGVPRPLANGVLLSPGSMPVFGVFSVSQAGRLVYLSEGGNYNDAMTVMSDWPRAR